MTGAQVRTARENLGWTQVHAAHRWNLSQTYLSLVEGDKRPVPAGLVRRLARKDAHLATGLPLEVPPTPSEDLPLLLGSLKYPGFEYLGQVKTLANPAAVVLDVLRRTPVPARVTEALPWVLMTFADRDFNWNWLVDQSKLANVQNRLGYLVGLARTVAARRNDAPAAARLAEVEQRLEDARLAKEDSLGEALTDAERRYLRERRPAAAAHWNLLTDLRAEDLRYDD